MKSSLLLGLLAMLFLNTAVSSQCDPNFDFGGAAFDYYPNGDESEAFTSGVINESYADVFHFVFPTDAGEIDPILGGLGLDVDFLTFDGVTVFQDGSEVDLTDIGIVLMCNNMGVMELDCSFLPDMQYCIALEGTAIESGTFELVFNFSIHSAIFGIPSIFPLTLTAVDLQIIGYGCADETACNYDEFAIEDNNFCIYGGCFTLGACNYDSTSTCDDGSCLFPEQYYNCEGECLSDSDDDGICDELEIPGCLDSLGCNYNPDATDDSGDCFYETEFYDCDGECFEDEDQDGVCDDLEVLGCTDEIACNFNSLATDDDGSCFALETFNLTGDAAPMQYSESVYSYPFTAGSGYAWEISSGVIVSNADGSATIEWTESGSNEICIIETDSEGCIGAQVCLEIDVILFIGIEGGDTNLSNVQLHPLPALDVIHVTGLAKGIYSYKIFNIQGQMVQSGLFEATQSEQLNIENLAKGFFVLQLETEHSVNSIRFMK
ncbi:MAG: hypothetical protein ACJAV7_000663 [Flavobacteriales bacterium]|jgi:hypothetical protein